MTTDSKDVLDELVEEWAVVLPDLDADPMLVVGRILRIANLLQAEVARELKPHGLHYTDFDILATLRRKGSPFELTPSELAASVILTSGAMTAAIGRLEKAALVKRTQDKVDRRSRRVKLTAKGVRLVDKTIGVRFSIAKANLEPLKETEIAKLAEFLKKMLAGIVR